MNTKIITVFSNKGGVGKTFVTVNLAVALALTKKRVLLIDLDFQGVEEMVRMLNVIPKKTLVNIFMEIGENIEKNNIKVSNYVVRHSSGVHFLPAMQSTKQANLLTSDHIQPFFKIAANEYDYILIDTGKFLSEILITILDHSHLILLVATPDILALDQTKWCLDILQNLQFPIKMVKLILNRSESRGSFSWQDVKAALPCEIFNHIPSDGRIVGMALNRGIPCVVDSPKSKIAHTFSQMVKALEKESLYVQTTNLDKLKTAENVAKPGQFWEKFGISQDRVKYAASDFYVSKDDEMASLKKNIHQKLVEQLNLDGVTTEVLSNPQEALKVKKTAEEVVGSLLLQEGGGLINSYDERLDLVKEIVSEALGLGPLEPFLADPEVTDIMVNHCNEIYVEKGGKLYLTDKKFVSEEKMRAIIDRIIAPLGRRIDESTPMVDARLPDGSRINAIIPPLSLNGPMITIRKFGEERITLDDLLKKYNSLDQNMVDFLKACVVSRKNIIVSGGTGAGKTTVLNIISELIPDNERIITIEDAAELKIRKSHWARLESRPSNVEGRGEVTIRDLFVNCLRMRPDRIVIGECRGGEVLDMLQAMNTGHDGSMTTLHANSPKDVITRLHSLILLSGIELPDSAITEMIASAIHIIVQISRFSDGSRKITGISEVVAINENTALEIKDVFIYDQQGIDKEERIMGEFKATGYVPTCHKDFFVRGLKLSQDIYSK